MSLRNKVGLAAAILCGLLGQSTAQELVTAPREDGAKTHSWFMRQAVALRIAHCWR